jgi:hypothetical protein
MNAFLVDGARDQRFAVQLVPDARSGEWLLDRLNLDGGRRSVVA